MSTRGTRGLATTHTVTQHRPAQTQVLEVHSDLPRPKDSVIITCHAHFVNSLLTTSLLLLATEQPRKNMQCRYVRNWFHDSRRMPEQRTQERHHHQFCLFAGCTSEKQLPVESTPWAVRRQSSSTDDIGLRENHPSQVTQPAAIFLHLRLYSGRRATMKRKSEPCPSHTNRYCLHVQ